MSVVTVESRCSEDLDPEERAELLAQCALAYDEPLEGYFADIGTGCTCWRAWTGPS